MGFYKEEIKDYFLLDTPVENMFINEYMAAAPGDYVKVYLFSLMYAGLGVDLSNADVARHLHMEAEDVLKAWTYWEKQGIIRKHRKGSESGFDYDVEFILLKEQLYGQSSWTQAPTQSISQLMEDPQVKQMVSDIEQISGRVYSSTEMQKMLAWIDDYQLLPEVITYAFRYGKIVLATTTYNGDIFPFMKTFIDHLTERGFRGRKIGLIENGSWAPTAAKVLKSMLESCKDTIFAENTVTIVSSMKEENIVQLNALADEMMS